MKKNIKMEALSRLNTVRIHLSCVYPGLFLSLNLPKQDFHAVIIYFKFSSIQQYYWQLFISCL